MGLTARIVLDAIWTVWTEISDGLVAPKLPSLIQKRENAVVIRDSRPSVNGLSASRLRPLHLYISGFPVFYIFVHRHRVHFFRGELSGRSLLF